MSELRMRLRRQFEDPEYRNSYLESFLNSSISGQIKALREREEWSQEKLAEKVGSKQPSICRLERADYASWKLTTLLKLARAFDLALSVKFVSYGEAIEDVVRFRENRLLCPSFKDDPAFKATDVPPVIAEFSEVSRRVLPFKPLKSAVQSGPDGSGITDESLEFSFSNG